MHDDGRGGGVVAQLMAGHPRPARCSSAHRFRSLPVIHFLTHSDLQDAFSLHLRSSRCLFLFKSLRWVFLNSSMLRTYTTCFTSSKLPEILLNLADWVIDSLICVKCFCEVPCALQSPIQIVQAWRTRRKASGSDGSSLCSRCSFRWSFSCYSRYFAATSIRWTTVNESTAGLITHVRF